MQSPSSTLNSSAEISLQRCISTSRCAVDSDPACSKTNAILNKVLSDEQGTPYLKLLFHAMERVGCQVQPLHIVIENCKTFNGFGGFDSSNNEIVLCENKFADMSEEFAKRKMNSIFAHELVHTFDHCRAEVDFYDNPKHSMCSEIRAAALSGQCVLENNWSSAVSHGFKKYHEQCVKLQAMNSFRALHPTWSYQASAGLMKEVFPMCYKDTEPFDRIPLSTRDAELSFKAYMSRYRYKT